MDKKSVEKQLTMQKISRKEINLDLTQSDLSLIALLPGMAKRVLQNNWNEFINNYPVQLKSYLGSSSINKFDLEHFIEKFKKKQTNFPSVLYTPQTEYILGKKYLQSSYVKNEYFDNFETYKLRPEFENFRDPTNQLHFVLATVTVLVVDDKRIPKKISSWEDLQDDEFKGLITMPNVVAHPMQDCILGLYYLYGKNFLSKFIDNLGPATHPSKQAKKDNPEKSPSIQVAPYHFAKISQAIGKKKIIFPTDGCIISPFYLIGNKKNPEFSQKVLDFVTSPPLIEKQYKIMNYVLPTSTTKDIWTDKKLIYPGIEWLIKNIDNALEWIQSKVTREYLLESAR
ncbi:MAG: ABC transporter substrate-binding protein [Candidatus Ranarchaeia archaeon]